MSALRTIAAVTLACLVLISSTSFIVGLHICMGQVENIALFDHADSCQKEKSLPACHKQMKPACCEDETVFHEATNFKASVERPEIVPPAPIDVEQPLVPISEVIPVAEISRTQYYNYDPPFRSSDLTVFLQVFLI
jgi:hypothetical protein